MPLEWCAQVKLNVYSTLFKANWVCFGFGKNDGTLL